VFAALVGFATRRKVLALLFVWLLVSGVSLGVLVLIGSWTVHTFSSKPIGPTAIAVDSRGTVRIAYVDGGLRYATNAGGSWAYETLDGEHYVGRLSLAVDSGGQTHVVYDACTTLPPDCRSRSSVEYQTDLGRHWTRRTLDANGEAPSLALDSQGSVYVAYMSYVPNSTSYFGSNLSVRFVTNRGGAWSNATAWGWLGSRDDQPALTSIALGRRGAIHIAFTLFSGLRYMTNESGSWDGSWLPFGGLLNDEPPVLATDSIGRLHLVFLGFIQLGMRGIRDFSVIHGVRTDGNWSFEGVDRATGVSPSSYGMALDASDHVHVVYSDRGAGTLKYATNRGGAWTVTTIERGSVVGLHCSIAVDTLARPRVAYTNFEGSSSEGPAPPLGGRYATTIVDASNVLDFLLGMIPLVLVELIILWTAGVMVRWLRRRGGSRRNPAGPHV
jgi:hypothetical protein